MFANWSAWWRGATLVGRVTQLESDLCDLWELAGIVRKLQDDQGEMLLGLHALQRRLEDHLKNWPDDEAYSGMGL